MEEEQEVLRKLVIAEEDIVKSLKRLVTKAEKFIQIEKSTGRIYLSNEAAGLTHVQQIALLLIGRYFAWRLKFVDSEFMPLRDIAAQLAVPMTTLSGPLAKLVTRGIATKRGKGEYGVIYYKIEHILDDIIYSQTPIKKMRRGVESV